MEQQAAAVARRGEEAAYALPQELAPRAVRLRPGGAYAWYGASGQQAVLAWLRLPGFGWSKSVKLRCPPRMRAAGARLAIT